MKEIEEVNSPIIYIAITLLFSSFFYGILNDYKGLAIFIASLFFIFIFKTTNKSFLVCILLVFSFGYLICHSFFSTNINEDFSGDLRIVEEKNYYCIGEIEGKRVIISEKLKGRLGERFYVQGEYSENKNVERGVVGELKVKSSKKIEGDITTSIYRFREGIYNKLCENLGQRKGALVASLAFGYSNYLYMEDKEDFKSFGVIHAISVSGLHVSIVFLVVSFLIGKKGALILTGLYVFFTGIPFSSLRALIMLITSYSALSLKKKYNALGGLAISSIIIFLIRPYSIFSLGFILSYTSTLGIVLFSGKIESYLFRLPKYLRSTLAISIGAQVFSILVLLLAFKEISIFFIVGNLLLIPLLNIIIILGNVSIVFYFIPVIFDFISYLAMRTIDGLDYLVDKLFIFNYESLFLNEGIGILYSFILVGVYFMWKGYKGFIFLPISFLIIFALMIYSPFMRIQYLREGGVLLSYKGERVIVTNKRNIDVAKLKKVNLCDNVILQGDKITLNKDWILNREGGNFTLKTYNKEYFLRLNNRGKAFEHYDIIDFVNEGYKGFYLFNEEAFLFK